MRVLEDRSPHWYEGDFGIRKLLIPSYASAWMTNFSMV
jgi:hypothetical protein